MVGGSLILLLNPLYSQKSFFKPSDTLNHQRLLISSGFSAICYSSFSIGLYHAWYKEYNTGKFKLFNDAGEWRNMDKLGHLYNGFFQSDLIYQGARWTGMSKQTSIWTAMGVSMLFLSTIEVYDGHSRGWGFSWPDMAANVLGVGLFGVQQSIFNQQKLYLKFSAFPEHYPMDQTILERRQSLYGSNPLQRVLKDYNQQIYWMSFHPGKKICPLPWLNLAIGYGANGMLGGFENKWLDKNGNTVQLDPKQYLRYSQYYLSLDLDLRKIPVKNPWLKNSLRILQIFKVPAPTIEVNSMGKLKAHWFR